MIFVEAHREKNRIFIESDMRDREACQTISGARWDRDNRQWHVPLTWAACKQLRSTFGDRLRIGPILKRWAQAELKARVEPAMQLRDTLELPDDGGFAKGLYPFQKAGALFLFTAKQALLGDPLGSGKTIQVIGAAQAVNALPALVICPATMRRTWAKELERWWPHVPTHVIEGGAQTRAKKLAEAADNKGFVIINWEAIRLHSRLAKFGSISLTEKQREPKELNQIPFRLVVADEAHRAKDPHSQQTRALWAIGQNPMVEYRWALTGTPLTNAPDTLFPILHFLDPLEWPSKSAFLDRYCVMSRNFWGGMEVLGLRQDREEEFFSIFDPRFRRTPKEKVLSSLPELVFEERHVDMAPKQAKAYKTMAESMFAEDENGNMIIASNPIAQLTRLAQYASAYVEMTPDGPKLSSPSCKLDRLMEDLPDFLQDNSVAVFAQSRQLIEMAEERLEKAGISHVSVKGGQSPDQRQNAIDAFQNGQVLVILVVIQAGGTGITLTKASVGIWLQRPWSNVDYKQSLGRIHRIGSEIHDNVVVVNYITSNTVEARQLEVLDNKEDMLQDILRDPDSLKKFTVGEVF